MNLIDLIGQTRVSIADARVLYRQAQAMKRDGEVGQGYVNSISDDIDGLERYFRELTIRADALVKGVEFPDVSEEESARIARERITARLNGEGMAA